VSERLEHSALLIATRSGLKQREHIDILDLAALELQKVKSLEIDRRAIIRSGKTSMAMLLMFTDSL
jgi:hypothetical protein